ncbi:MAG: T9SS type A sorting domain-containing protein [Sphingobacteriales bacterium]|nr:MAG: T9SS type A sorting domain-containing protein [Sphingobacteriales bacterium]
MKLTSGFGNNLFIDDITVSNTLDVPGQELPQFSIYPNPATDRITVKATKSFSDDVTLQVSDMAGKLVRSMTITQGVQQIDIDVASLVNGTYVLSIKSGDAVSQEKITIMK